MKLAKSVLFGAASLAFGLGSAYGAAAKAKESAPGFNALDQNHDGYLSEREAARNPELARTFKTADKNHDGKLSRMEYLAVMTRQDLNTAREKISRLLRGQHSGAAQ